MWYAMSAPERSISGEIHAQVRVRADSRWFSGHFPDLPVLPAIAQVSMVVDMVARATVTPLYLKKASRIKFKQLVAPDCELTLQAWAGAEQNQYRYRISEGLDEVSSGTLVLAHKDVREHMQHEKSATTIRIAEIVINELKLEDVSPETFDPDLDLVDEVGIDSMDLATIALVIRDEFGIRIDEDDYPKLTTLRIIAGYIDEKKNEA
ncbi:MAG: phosphopantetheine-binding protein [bacterium]|nr:phosphopantetheine-binding protein [bacterium]